MDCAVHHLEFTSGLCFTLIYIINLNFILLWLADPDLKGHTVQCHNKSMMFHHMSCSFGPKQWTANCSFTFFRSTVTDMIVKWLLYCCLPDVKPVYWLVPKKRQRSYSNVGSIFHCSCHFGVHHWSLAYSRICCATSRMPSIRHANA